MKDRFPLNEPERQQLQAMRERMIAGTPTAWCPYPACDFAGTDEQVDEHRAENHRDEPQQGSNLSHRPTE